MKKYDFVIIGGGIGGLICGCILSREGFRVCILEKHYTIGGGLHVFKKHRQIFETGIHYVSGFLPGQVMDKLFSYLGVMENVKLKNLDSDAFDVLHIGEDGVKYRLGSGRENFVRALSEHFAHERENIIRYLDSIDELSRKFYLFNLEPRVTDLFSLDDELVQPVGTYIDQFFTDPRLKKILAWNNSLYAGNYDKTPAYVHILITRFYLEGATRFVDGPQQLADNMADMIRAGGGDVFTSCEVTRIEVDNKAVQKVWTRNGQFFEAEKYISAIHPATMLEMLEEDKIQRSYRNRINSLNNTTSVFTVFIVFKEGCFPYMNYNYYYSPSYESIWSTTDYTAESWPQGMMLLTPPTSGDNRFAEKMIVNCIMNYEDVKKWENTQAGRRGEDYLTFKKLCTDKILNILSNLFPGIEEHIEHVSASTPLTIRDYTGSRDGSLYGIEKDCQNLIGSHIVPRTKINNLYLTGQNINLHGLIGVALSAIQTAGEFVGVNTIIQKINKDYQQN